MKSISKPQSLLLILTALLAQFAGVSAFGQAGPYYWDDNAAGTGFGTAGASTGTWAALTAGPTAGWSTSSTGANAFAAVTTATTDISENFGTATATYGLGAGTVTVSGTVNSGPIIFGSQSGAIVLSGGTITLPAAATITANNTSDTISSILAGAGTSLTVSGTGTLVLSGANTYAGTTKISAGSTLQVGAGGTSGSISAANITDNGTLAYNFSNTTTVSLPASTLSGTGNLSGTAGFFTINGNMILGGSMSFTQTGTSAFLNGLLLTTPSTLQASAITLSGDFGGNGSSANACNLNTTGNGAISLNISVGRNGIAYPLSSFFNVNAGTGAINVTGTGPASSGWRGSPITLTGAVNITANVADDTALTINPNGTTTGNVSGALSGAMSLTESGSGTVSLSGPSTFTGGLTVSGGKLSFPSDGTSGGQPLGAYPGTVSAANVTISGGGTLNCTASTGTQTIAVNRGITLGTGGGTVDCAAGGTLAISSVITGGGALTKGANSGTVTLNAANTYTGLTTVNGGTLTLGSSAGLSTSSAITVASGATLNFNSYNALTTTTAWTNSGTINNLQTGGSTSQTMPPTVILTNGTLSGGASSSGYGTYFVNPSTITANGNANTISAGNIGGGSLTVNTPLATDALTISSVLGASSALGLSLTKSGLGTMTLSGANIYTGGTTINASGGTLQIGGTGKLNSGSYAGAIAIGSSSTLKYSSSANQTLSGNITGSGALTKDASSASTLTLSGSANSYTGATTVNAGTLLVNSPGSLASGSTVTVADGATLGGNGTINGPVNVLAGGNLAPGGVGTIGTLTLANNSATSLTLNGNVLLFDLPNTGTTCDLIAINGASGALVLNGANYITLNAPNGAIPASAGTYTLMTYASKTGSGTLTFPNGSTTMGNATLSVTGGSGSSGSVTLTVGTGGLNTDVWKGSVSGGWDNSILNWTKNGTASQAYAAGDAVTFDDSGSVAATISSVGPVSPASVVFNNNVNNYTVSAVIGGSTTPLLKNGTGTLTLSGANTYAGGTTVNAGTLKLGVASALSSSGNLTINPGATVNMNGNADTVGTVTLNYGGTITTGGELKIGSGGFFTTGGTVNNWPGIGLGGNFTYNTASGNETTATIGAVDMNGGSRTFNINHGVQAIDVDITVSIYDPSYGGNRNLIKDGAGTLRISGGSGNDNYGLLAGTTTIKDGVLLLNKSASVNAVGGSGLITVGDSVGSAGSAILRHNTGSANGQITQNNAVTINSDGLWDLNGHNETTTGALTVNASGQVTSGGGNLSVGALTVNGSVNTGGGNLTGTTLAMTAGSIATGAGTYNLGGDVALTGASSASTISGILALGTAVRTFTIADGAAATDLDLQAQITSAAGGGLTKAGPGLMQLSGANTYTGATTVNGGTLLVNSPGILASGSAVTVASGATLGGNGTINGPVNVSVGGLLAPGGAGTIGTLTLANNSATSLTLNGNVLLFDLPNTGTTCDLIAISGASGALVLNGANYINLNAPGGAVPAGTYTLMTYASKTGSGTLTFPNGSLTMGNATLTVTAGTGTAGSGNVTLTVDTGGLNFGLDTWAGSVSGVWDGGNANWTRNGSASSTYTTGDAVTFDDSGSATATISSVATVSPASVVFNNNANNYTVSAVIGGSTTPLLKNGTGTLTLSGANTYAGGTTVNAGTLKLGVASALSSSGNLTINPGATVNMNGNAATPSTVTLNYGGTIQTSWSGTLLKTGSGGFITTGGTVDAWPGIGLGGNFTYNTASGNETTATIGAVDMNGGSRTFNINHGVQAIDVDIVGNIFDPAYQSDNITKSGTGTLRLSGPGNYNLVAGQTIIKDGVLLLNKAAGNNAVGGSGTIQIGDGTGLAGSAILRHATGSGNGQITQNNAVTINSDGLWDLNGHNETTTGALTVNTSGQVTAGGGNLSVGALTVNGSVNTGGGNLTGTTLAMTAGSIATGAGTYNLGGDVTLTGASSASTISGILALGTAVRTFTIADGAAATDLDLQAQITSAAGGGLTKAGPGLMQLSGANTYSGNTVISAGTLTLGSSGTLAGTPKISIVSSATFDVSAPSSGFTFTGSSPVQTLAGGSTSGTAMVNATGKTLTLASGALASFAAAGGASTTVGKISVTGNLTLNANALTVNVTGSALAAGSYRLLDCTGTLTGSANSSPTITGTALSSGYTASVSTTAGAGGHVDLIVKATPAISGVTSSQSISYGTSSISLSGTVSATGGSTAVYPANGATVSVSINGDTQPAPIAGGAGGFSVSFPTATLPPSNTSYTITYAYAGDANLNAATSDTSTHLTVSGVRVPNLAYVNTPGIARIITLAEIQAAGLQSSQSSPSYSITAVGTPSNGGATLKNSNGTLLRYTNAPSFAPTSDSFSYTVSDGTASGTGTVALTFASVAGPQLTPTGNQISFHGIPGYTYHMQRATTLSPTPDWTAMPNAVTCDSNGVGTWTDPSGSIPNPVYYRLSYP